MKQILYSHNLKAYEAVKAHYAEGNRKACVVHATGTGKSYIIAALAEDYERVLLVAPNDYVLDQVRKNAESKIQYVTYAKLMTDAKKRNSPYRTLRLDSARRVSPGRSGAVERRRAVSSSIQCGSLHLRNYRYRYPLLGRSEEYER